MLYMFISIMTIFDRVFSYSWAWNACFFLVFFMKILHCARWRFYKGVVLGLVVKNVWSCYWLVHPRFISLKKDEKPSSAFHTHQVIFAKIKWLQPQKVCELRWNISTRWSEGEIWGSHCEAWDGYSSEVVETKVRIIQISQLRKWRTNVTFERPRGRNCRRSIKKSCVYFKLTSQRRQTPPSAESWRRRIKHDNMARFLST